MKNFYVYVLVAVLTCFQGQAQTFRKISGKPAAINSTLQQLPAARSTEALNSLNDGFESYNDFSLDFAPWTLIDADGAETWGIEGVEFTNQYSPMSFIIFNPSSTNPPMTSAAILPHGGLKIAACFASNGATNNDWLISPPLSAGTNTSVSFWVKSYTAQYGLERYKVAVSTTGTDPADFTYISGSNYLTAPATDWEQKTFDLNAYNGQTIYVGIHCVSDDAFIFMVDDFSFTTTTSSTSTLTGLVTDAFDGTPIPGATVTIAGLSTTTDQSGNYTINNIPAGTLNAAFTSNVTQGAAPLAVNFFDQSSEGSNTVTCSKQGYITYVNNNVVVPQGQTLNLNISLTQTLLAGNMRFVLNWGATPEDLDSHLNTPSIEGQPYHIYYSDQGSATSAPYAALDHDVTSGYGPETMTIYQMFDGTYQYYIHNYSEAPAITTSQAVLQIYNQSGLIQTMQIPTIGNGLYWYVCDINGSNGQLTIKNIIQETPPGNIRFELPDKASGNVAQNSRNITSWNWNFGDGGSSTQQNPSHTYTTAGTYTVSLTISDGTNTDTETKTGYITVTGGSSGNGALTGLVTDAVNGNPVEGALVSVAGKSATTDVNGNYTITGIPAGTLVANFNASQTSGSAPLTVIFTDQSTENAHTVTCSKSGYITYSNNQVVIPDGGSLELNISLSPELAAGNMRFVLNWGATPEDLDSHLNTPNIEGNTYHIYYSDEGNATAAPFALLDYDITEGFGPETMTIYKMFSGTYQYFIHNYSEEPSITTSQAVVQIYDQSGLLYTLQVPTSGTGLYWYVCDVDGATGNIIIRNVIQQNPPSGKKDLWPAKDPAPSIPAERNITSWLWNFGDGGTSTQQNPSHTFNANGTYTISLTVSTSTAQATETKTAYIQVGPQGIGESGLSDKITAFPVPAESTMQLDSPELIKTVIVTDLTGKELKHIIVNDKKTVINTSQLNSGTYLLIIETGLGKAIKKFNVK